MQNAEQGIENVEVKSKLLLHPSFLILHSEIILL